MISDTKNITSNAEEIVITFNDDTVFTYNRTLEAVTNLDSLVPTEAQQMSIHCAVQCMSTIKTS